MRPTPELSFAVREYGCVAGLNVTASHNPRSTMATRSIGPTAPSCPQHAAAIARQMEALDVFDDVRTMDYEQARAQGGSSPCWAGRPMTNSSPTCWIRLTTGRPWPR